MAEQKLAEAHKRYILQQVASFEVSPVAIARRLSDKGEAERFGFRPVSISHQRVSVIIRDFDEKEVALERARFLADYSDCPLAHKKNRILELVKMYDKLEVEAAGADLKELSKFRALQLQCIRDIKNEIGEDIDKIADALRNSGSTTVVNFNFDKMPDEQREGIRDSIRAVYGW